MISHLILSHYNSILPRGKIVTVGGLIGTVTATKNGLIKAGILVQHSVGYLKSIKINITSGSFFVSMNVNGVLDYFSFYGYNLSLKKRIGNNSSYIRYFYDSANHVFYIQSNKQSGENPEVSILDMQNKSTIEISDDDVSGYDELSF